MKLICDTLSPFSARLMELAADSNFACQRMTSNELASEILIYRSDTSLEVLPQTPALILDTGCAAPLSFDEDFLSQEKETTIRAWAMLNPRKVLSCINIERADPSAGKTSCAIIEKEFDLCCRREVFSLLQAPTPCEGTGLWSRDWYSQSVVVTQKDRPLSMYIGPFWGRGALPPGRCSAFLVVDDWCRNIRGEGLEAALAALTSKIANRLHMSVGFFVWWIEHESKALFLAKIDRSPPAYLPEDIRDEAIRQIFKVLAL